MIIRDYFPKDYRQILEISKHIWDGHDYLPDRINEFYEDNYSFPMVVEANGKIQTVGNMRLISNEIVWLEAIRTHPNSRGKGFGTKLTEAQLKKAKDLDIKEAWVLTSLKNMGTYKILEKLKFVETHLIKHWKTDRKDFDIQLGDQNGLYPDGILGSLKHLERYTSKKSLAILPNIEACVSVSKLAKVLKKLMDLDIILGEYLAYPPVSRTIDTWIENGEIYYIEDPAAIITIRKSREVGNLVILGITSDIPEVIVAALIFTQKKYPKSKVEMFYTHNIKHKLFDIPNEVFRLMKKKI